MRPRHRGDLDGQGCFGRLAEGSEAMEIQSHLVMAYAGLLGVPVRREIRALQPEHGRGSLNVAFVKILGRVEPSRRPEISARHHKADPRVGRAQ